MENESEQPIRETPGKRVRTGCQTCRRRRRKCDEKRPVCENCSKKDLGCRYGVQLTFLVTNASSLRSPDGGAALQSSNTSVSYSRIQFVEESRSGGSSSGPGVDHEENAVPMADLIMEDQQYVAEEVVEEDPSSSQPLERVSVGLNATPVNIGTSPTNIQNMSSILRSDSSLQSQAIPTPSGRESGWENMEPASLTPFNTNLSPVHGSSDISTSTQVSDISTEAREVDLMRYYRYVITPTLDICDLRQHFGIALMLEAKNSPSLKNSILALAAKQRELNQKIISTSMGSESGTFYSSAMRLTWASSHTQNHQLAYIYILLKYFDVISVEPREWRRCAKEIIPFFDSLAFQALKNDMTAAMFWFFARMDISAALVTGERVIFPLESYLPPGTTIGHASRKFAQHQSMDIWARYSIFLCARCIEIKTDRDEALRSDDITYLRDFPDRWKALWDEMQDWRVNRPRELCPLFETGNSGPADFNEKAFPTILFSTGSGNCANQLHHAGAMLLLQCKPNTLRTSNSKGAVNSKMWHAHQICSIATSVDTQECCDLALVASLLLAARVMTHEGQHAAIVGSLRKVMGRTGWKLDGVVGELQASWDLADSMAVREGDVLTACVPQTRPEH